MWNRKKLQEKLEYMNAHPVPRKLVVHPQDGPWRSWAYSAKGEGLIHLDPVD